MRRSQTLLAAAFAGVTGLATMQSASAAPLQIDRAFAANGANVETIQYRPGWHHHGGYGYRHGYGHRGYGTGAAVIGGLAAGAIIGGAIANSRAQARQDAVSYCAQRYKSYDPASGTYLNYDGRRYACP